MQIEDSFSWSGPWDSPRAARRCTVGLGLGQLLVTVVPSSLQLSSKPTRPHGFQETLFPVASEPHSWGGGGEGAGTREGVVLPLPPPRRMDVTVTAGPASFSGRAQLLGRQGEGSRADGRPGDRLGRALGEFCSELSPPRWRCFAALWAPVSLRGPKKPGMDFRSHPCARLPSQGLSTCGSQVLGGTAAPGWGLVLAGSGLCVPGLS